MSLPDHLDAISWDGGFANVPEDADARERFKVVDDSAATWTMRKLAALRKREAELDAIAAQETERIRQWRAAQAATLEPDIAYFEGLLIEYAKNERDQNGRKSIVLPHGKIASRAGSERVDVVDADAFIKWAQANSPLLVRVRAEPDKTAIKANLLNQGADGAIDKTTGEIVPGVAFIKSDTTYSIDIS
jgi:hypothetical protein